jgi:hypothetical protein
MKTLPSTDVFGRFHRRRNELAIPQTWLEALHEPCIGVPLSADETLNGLVLRFAMGSGEPLGFHMPHEVVFLLIDTMDHAIWAAEWERDGQPDEAGS